MSTALYWFRQDLRLTDQPALLEALTSAERVVLCCPMPDFASRSAFGLPRFSAQREAWWRQAIDGLSQAIRERGGELLTPEAPAAEAVIACAQRYEVSTVYCEALATPEEQREVAALQAQGLRVCARWQSTLLELKDLPFELPALPVIFTQFRRRVESAQVVPHRPLSAPDTLEHTRFVAGDAAVAAATLSPEFGEFRLFQDARFSGCEAAGQAYVRDYFASDRPRSYKETRNDLSGIDGSTKFSAWLATGAISARSCYDELRRHESTFGANDSTYWIWFELLWRDYFKFWCARHGRRIFTARGLADDIPSHNPQGFARWCSGRTGDPFIDAGMRELAATGTLSNRMRQVVASYLVHDLGADWRAGAEWFESRLVDFDVTSNQGNWAYVSGRGADPRSGRRFDPDSQAARYDADGAYRRLWSRDLSGAVP